MFDPKKKVKKERNEEKLLDTPCSNLLSSAKMEGEEREKKNQKYCQSLSWK